MVSDLLSCTMRWCYWNCTLNVESLNNQMLTKSALNGTLKFFYRQLIFLAGIYTSMNLCTCFQRIIKSTPQNFQRFVFSEVDFPWACLIEFWLMVVMLSIRKITLKYCTMLPICVYFLDLHSIHTYSHSMFLSA